MSWIKADLHIHSYVSDGGMSPRDVVRYAEQLGLEAISVTDHDTFLGSYIASKRRSRVVIVPGAEFRTEYGDVLVLCEHIPVYSASKLKLEKRELRYVRLSSLVDSLVAKENCVTVAAHPFAVVRRGSGRLFELNYLDCVEVYNSSSDIVTNIYTVYVARNKMCKIAGSDAHVIEMVGSVHTLVEVGDLSPEEIIEGIRKARTVPCYNLAPEVLKPARFARRILHSLRIRLGNYGNPWKRVSMYPI